MENMPEMEELLIHRGAQALKAGNLVAFPTETVYGLGADATNSQAIKKIYAIFELLICGNHFRGY